MLLLGAGASRAALPNGDRSGRILPLMRDLADVVGLRSTIEAAGIELADDFEAFYGDLVENAQHLELTNSLEGQIRRYFLGLALPDEATLYDMMVVSLRPKDLIATFNWDPFLIQAYTRNRMLKELPRLVFLHGNVAVGICTDHKRKGRVGEPCGICRRPLEPTPLLYPVKQKNYTDSPFISAEWEEFRAYLRHAYMLTIVGYSAPESDIEARQIMAEVWNSNKTRSLAEISVIDIKDHASLTRTWGPFFAEDHHHFAADMLGSWLFAHSRRSCEALAMATLQQQPCEEHRIPPTDSLEDLQAWVSGLIREELALREHGTPLPC